MKRSIRDLVDLEGKKILLRTDFNVPIDRVGRILDKTRINAAIPTIDYLVKKGAKVIICSHLGRPKGFDIKLSLWPISLILMKYFPGKVQFSQKTIGERVKQQIDSLSNGSILLLENTRFHQGETENDKKFAKELASLADIYVNDAFGVCHRKHASTYGASRLLPNAIGFLVENELKAIEEGMKNPSHPFVAIFGGLKVEDKIKVLSNLIDKADTILIGGAMAYPFLVAKWISVGRSPASTACVATASEILKEAEAKGKKIILPVDHIAIRYNKPEKSFATDVLEEDMIGVDIGPKTIELFIQEIKKAKQVIWNGPLGKYEDAKFTKGTSKIAEAIAESQSYSVIGGGDSISAVNKTGKANMISHLSTGGGATMKLLEGNSLPCIEIIQEKII